MIDLLPRALHSLLQPFACLGCEAFEFKPLCRVCQKQWTLLDNPLPALKESNLHTVWLGNEQVYRSFRHWKLTHSPELERLLFKLSPKLKQTLLEKKFDAIVPIPQESRRSWRRGHESSKKVARFFANELGVPVWPLLSLAQTEPFSSHDHQAERDRLDRELSLNPFKLNTRALGQPQRILLVDDVITTGMTLEQAKETLRNGLQIQDIQSAALVYRPRRRHS